MSKKHTLERQHDLSIFWPRHNFPWLAVANSEPGRERSVEEHVDEHEHGADGRPADTAHVGA
jgi:hypothetical protein